MPFFKSTYNILKKPDEDEVFNPNWMDSNTLILPDYKEWDYGREMTIEDVDIWEVIYEKGGGIGVYASWLPYAEFYMITSGWRPLRLGQTVNDRIIETYYGAGSNEQVRKRAAELGIFLPSTQVWVDSEDMWLYQPPSTSKIITTGDIQCHS
jgi:hypothetical protein